MLQRRGCVFVTSAVDMSIDLADAGEPVAYAYRPSLLGAAREFKLAGDGIDWAAGRREGHIPFRTVRRLRLSYRPTSMQSHRFMTELWADGAPKPEILSSSWKSVVEQERLDKRYAAFIAELHRRIALAAAPARFEQGSNPLLYWPGLLIFVGVALGLALLVMRALQEPTPKAARPSSAAFSRCSFGRAVISFAAIGRGFITLRRCRPS